LAVTPELPKTKKPARKDQREGRGKKKNASERLSGRCDKSPAENLAREREPKGIPATRADKKKKTDPKRQKSGITKSGSNKVRTSVDLRQPGKRTDHWGSEKGARGATGGGKEKVEKKRPPSGVRPE